MVSLLVVLGTRPEAVKLAPVIHAARRFDDWRVRVCNTGQHRELLEPALQTLALRPDVSLAVMRPGQNLGALLEALLCELGAVLDAERPDVVVAQGDTTTALAAALTATARGIAMVHVEAGLRTGDLEAPFPEEANRVTIGRLARLHLAPTPRAAANLRAEGVRGTIVVTGNTVVDAVRSVRGRTRPLPPDRRPSVLVTGHRRESFCGGLDAVCAGLVALARRHPEVDLVYPVHLNPAVQRAVWSRLAGMPNIRLLPPQPYPALLGLMARARFVITDSGGIQEEAPELGKPVLVTRTCTERLEAVEQGCAVLVGHDPDALVRWADRWLRDPDALAAATPTHNPFGDGNAGPRCVAAIRAQIRRGWRDAPLPALHRRPLAPMASSW